MDTETVERKGNCIICGDDNDFNVCIKCDAIKTAREIMHHAFFVGQGNQDEVTKKIKMAETIAFYEKYFKGDLKGLEENEIPIYNNYYNNEMNRLKKDGSYSMQIFKFNSQTNKMDQNIIFLYDAMRWGNILKNCAGCKKNLCSEAKEKYANIKDIINCNSRID